MDGQTNPNSSLVEGVQTNNCERAIHQRGKLGMTDVHSSHTTDQYFPRCCNDSQRGLDHWTVKIQVAIHTGISTLLCTRRTPNEIGLGTLDSKDSDANAFYETPRATTRHNKENRQPSHVIKV